jgi:uncharacterized delta-60 repeat protein
MLLSRVNSDGTPDSTFGTNGYVASGASEVITNLVIQSDGKILGSSGTMLFRFNANGTSDATFGSNGIVNAPFPISKTLVQASGKIIVGGTLNNDFAVACFNSNGTLDPIQLLVVGV